MPCWLSRQGADAAHRVPETSRSRGHEPQGLRQGLCVRSGAIGGYRDTGAHRRPPRCREPSAILETDLTTGWSDPPSRGAVPSSQCTPVAWWRLPNAAHQLQGRYSIVGLRWDGGGLVGCMRLLGCSLIDTQLLVPSLEFGAPPLTLVKGLGAAIACENRERQLRETVGCPQSSAALSRARPTPRPSASPATTKIAT